MAAAGRARLEKKSSSQMFKQITPPHLWKDDLDFHYLRLTLPGFDTHQVMIHVDKYGHLVVRGNKQVSEHKYISFEESFDIPNNTNIEDADGFFEEEQIYCITIPKTKLEIHMPSPRPEDNINPTTHDNSPKATQDDKVGSFGNYGSTKKPENTNNPLKVITAEKSNKDKVAMLFALLVIVVALIVKFRH